LPQRQCGEKLYFWMVVNHYSYVSYQWEMILLHLSYTFFTPYSTLHHFFHICFCFVHSVSHKMNKKKKNYGTWNEVWKKLYKNVREYYFYTKLLDVEKYPLKNDPYTHFSQQPHNKLTWLVIFYYFLQKENKRKQKK
jgi:hypothetical protein